VWSLESFLNRRNQSQQKSKQMEESALQPLLSRIPLRILFWYRCSFLISITHSITQGADGYTQYGQKVSVVLPNVLNLAYHTSRRGEDQRNTKMR